MKKHKIWLAVVMAGVLSLVMAPSAMADPPFPNYNKTAATGETVTYDVAAENPSLGVTGVNFVLGGSCFQAGPTSVTYTMYSTTPGYTEVCKIAVNYSGGFGVADFVITLASAADTQAPVVDITSPADGSTVSTSPVTLNYAATDDVGVTSCTASNGTPVTLVQGDNPITVTCYDAANNAGSDTVHVNYVPPDAQQPVVTITSPADNSVTTTSSTVIEFTATDNVGVVGCDRASGSTVALNPGPNLITVNCQDAIGNVGSASVNVTYNAPLTLTVSPGIGYEGDPGDPTTYIVFQVSLNRPTNQDVDIGYWALPSSASCIDFACNILLPKVKTIPAGQTTTQIKIAIKNDNRTEGLEKMILLYLSCDVPTAGYVYGTLVDDELVPPPNQN